MTTAESILLGTIQGITEFLPVSSSGHLLLAEHFMGTKDAGLAYDVMLHMGTLLAVLAYFRSDWLEMARGLFPRRGSGEKKGPGSKRLLLFIIIGTIPGAAIGYFCEHFVASTLRSPWVVVCTLAGVALLLAAAERFAHHRRGFERLGMKDALTIGLAQAAAIVPGVSRSGITMTAGLFLGLSREAAARFSFLLSAPIIAGAGLYEGLKLVKQGTQEIPPAYLWGFGASAISGYLVIAFLMNYLRRHTFYPFAAYRLILAAAVAMLLIAGGQKW